MPGTIGTLEWANRSGGRLSWAERLRLAAAGIAEQIKRSPAWRRRRAGIDAETLTAHALPERPPDSRLAKQAEDVCDELSSPTLRNHCLRTYVWGSLLGRRDGLDWDEELLYVSALLHDLGLTQRHFGLDTDSQCFAIEGARAAARHLEEAGMARERRDRVEEAITLHINPSVGVEHGAEAHLLARGAGFDVIGRDFRAVAHDTVDAVLERYPRLELKAELDSLMRSEKALRPGSRTAFYCRYGGFLSMIARAPFAT